MTRDEILDSYTDADLVELDRAGIKIIGIDFEQDDFSRDWAYRDNTK